ncbi:MAG: Phosphoglycerate kinase [Parcubacteria group bacterium GW2011_GWA2_51_10]|nr:MAG: Phosphoglycerate kinase [Parcubacteria group bacterium GW2011_GWA2_51_10]
MMHCIDEVPEGNLKGKRVLVRSGLDLPLNTAGNVSDIFRLTQACETIKYLSSAGARSIVISKIGRDPKDTNAPVAAAMKKFFPVFFVPALSGHAVESAIGAMRDGDIILLENLQQDPREVAGDDSFAKELAALADIYVNDAFTSAHRRSASMTGIPKFLPSYAGLLLRDEVNQLDAARKPASPSFAILGGAKFETKAPLVKSLLTAYDHLFIVGALANDVFKAKGYEVGISLISNELPDEDVLAHSHFLAPVDVTVERPDGQARTKKANEVLPDENIVDIGPDSIQMIAPLIAQAKSILWSGPTGIYERGYISYTHATADLISKSDAKKVIGGGDTIAAIQETGVPEEQLGFLSTGGGAMLEYLLKGTLPAIQALS